MKVRGAELTEFFAQIPDSTWDTWCVGGTDDDVADVDNLDPAKFYDTEEVCFLEYQKLDLDGDVEFVHGAGALKVKQDLADQGLDLATVVRHWRKLKTTATFVVTVPKGDEELFLASLKVNGWKAVKA